MTDAAPRANPPASAPSDAELMREQRLQRNLKAVIGILSLLILAGLGAVIFKMVQTATGGGGRAATAPTPATIAAAQGELLLELPKGAKVVSVSVSGNRLAVHHESPAGTGIAVIDIDTGRRIADVKTLDAVPRN